MQNSRGDKGSPCWTPVQQVSTWPLQLTKLGVAKHHCAQVANSGSTFSAPSQHALRDIQL